MVQRRYPPTPILSACICVWDSDRVLLAQRTRAPSAGMWAVPGGRVDVGETLEAAARRELREETALSVGPLTFVDHVEVIHRDTDGRAETHYVIAMFAAHYGGGEPVAGDDAGAVRWFHRSELREGAGFTSNTLRIGVAARDALGLDR